jgi:hypothetical protein
MIMYHENEEPSAGGQDDRPPTVVAAMPPRQRRVRWVDAEYEAVAFAVWSDGEITPVVEDGGRYVVIGRFRADVWELTS